MHIISIYIIIASDMKLKLVALHKLYLFLILYMCIKNTRNNVSSKIIKKTL